MIDEDCIYVKRGRRYRAVGRCENIDYLGYGCWWVKVEPGMRSETRAYSPDYHAAEAAIAAAQDELASAILQRMTDRHGASAMDLLDTVRRVLAEKKDKHDDDCPFRLIGRLVDVLADAIVWAEKYSELTAEEWNIDKPTAEPEWLSRAIAAVGEAMDTL